MSDVKTEPTPTETKAPAIEPVLKRLVDDLREAGQVGKKQWEDAIARTREVVARAPEQARAELDKAATRVRSTMTKGLEEAQGRGAKLLLRLVHEVRVRAEQAESTLEKKNQAQPQAA